MAIRFTEVMTGFYGPGAPAYDTGDLIGRRDGNRLSFQLTISADDVRDVIADPLHEMQATGTVLCTEFAAIPAAVQDGGFRVFAPAGRGRYTMRYRLLFEAGGRPLTLLGFKDVGDDWGPDMWPDTTTLNFRLFDGHVDWLGDDVVEGEHARGILRLTAPMFARELATFRGNPTEIGLFVMFFVNHLWAAYTGTRDRGHLK